MPRRINYLVPRFAPYFWTVVLLTFNSLANSRTVVVWRFSRIACFNANGKGFPVSAIGPSPDFVRLIKRFAGNPHQDCPALQMKLVIGSAWYVPVVWRDDRPRDLVAHNALVAYA